VELEWRRKRRASFAFGAEGFGKRLAGVFRECRLGIERIDVRRATVAKEMDYPRSFRRKVRLLGRQRISRGVGGCQLGENCRQQQ
jgi:hypothetical protein